ncbi:ExeA family protein [Candidatus Auribacterota bacterium]
MSYYKLLNLKKEPFSSSPDPAFLYMSESHKKTFFSTEIAIRLQRGLSVIIGAIGTGKTTLSRKLFQSFNQEENFIFHMVLDPSQNSEYQFTLSLARNMGIKTGTRSIVILKELIEQYLFKKVVEEKNTVVLVIDESQKLSLECLEVLRVLLNYETNEYKMIQVVLLGQIELLPKIKKLPNFLDRICVKNVIAPLDELDTKRMIEFRLKEAGYTGEFPLFTEDAIKEIYLHSKGYPRKIIFLCHAAFEILLMEEKTVVDRKIVQSVLEKESQFLAYAV